MASSADLRRVLGVPVEIRVELGRKSITISELLDAAPGQILMLDRLAGEYVDVYAADKLLGQGEVVVVDEEFGVRVAELFHRGARQVDDTPAELPAASWGS